MDENREVGYTYLENLEDLRKHINEADVLYPLMDRIKTEVDLVSAETCLSIGTGPGQYDIEFIKRCLPNLKRFIVVEKNADCISQLRSNLQKSLPDLDEMIHQELIEEWKGPDCQVDVILVFYVFHYIQRQDRLNLMEKFRSWLKSQTGVLVVIQPSDEVEKVCVVQKLFREMGWWSLPLEAEELKKEFISMRFYVHPEFKYHFTVDMRIFGSDMLKTIFPCQGFNDADDANIRKAVAKIAPNGFATAVLELFVVKSRRE